MTNRTVKPKRNRHSGTRASRAASNRKNGSVRAGKSIPRFAPNFTVYVLPPDTVCLYSEDRKFFLHGELYCALASAIGAGKSLQTLTRELEKDFPSDKIQEALKRLTDRRFIVPAARSSDGRSDAYWASLGLPPETAKSNLQKCRVRIQSLDVEGATELGDALKALGVRVVKGPADLTVTLVSDYLEARLAELNRQHLSDGTPWLLVQPSGIFPLVGPVFSPGKIRLLGLPRRTHAAQPRDQGVPRPQAGPSRRHFAARAGCAWSRRHWIDLDRDREGHRDRLSHRPARSSHQPRSAWARPS